MANLSKAIRIDEIKEQAKLTAEVNAMLLPDMPVYSVNEGEAIGRVKEVVIDPKDKCLLALAVDKGGWYHDVRVIPAGKINTIGDDIIMVDEKQSAEQPPNLPRIVEYMKNPCNIIGARLISEDGRSFGRVEGFYLAREGGAISRLELSGGIFSWLWAGKISLAASHIITLGTEAVVVDSGALEDLRVTAGVLKVNFQAAAEWAGQSAENLRRLREKAALRLKEMAEERRERTQPTEEEAAANL